METSGLSLNQIYEMYFSHLQFWHLAVVGGLIAFLANWHIYKMNWERENADLIAYEKAVKEIEEKKKLDRKKGSPK